LYVYDAQTEELIADMTEVDQEIVVALGGEGGLGNTVFKSSTNQAPRKITKGKPGDARTLRLELKVLADVGLLGLPNAGKSTFLRSVSQATPKVASLKGCWLGDSIFTALSTHKAASAYS